MKKLFVAIGVLIVVGGLILAILPFTDDGDRAHRAIVEKYGTDIFEKTYVAGCATDGVGVQRVLFGRKLQHCNTTWFVLGDMWPYQVK